MSELIILENVNAVELYTGDKLDDLLKKITEQAKSLVPDTSTAVGREAIASMAHKVAKAKVKLDDMGKDLTADWKKQSKAVDVHRKSMRDQLDALKTEVRLPLTKWEMAEAERVAKHENAIAQITKAGDEIAYGWIDYSARAINETLTQIKNIGIDKSWQEFTAKAAVAKDAAIAQIEGALAKRNKHDADQAELARLREESEKAEAARIESERAAEEQRREEAARKEGEEKARREAEEKAKQEADRIEAERVEAEAKAQAELERAENERLDAERRAKEAEENAARQAEQAAQDERDRIEQERIAEEVAAKKRESGKKHRSKINTAIVDSLALAGVSKADAMLVVAAIAKGQVPHVSIKY